MCAAQTAQTGDRKTAALQIGGIDLAIAHTRADLAQLLGNFAQAFFVGVAYHRDDQSVGRIDGHTDMKILLEYQALAIR